MMTKITTCLWLAAAASMAQEAGNRITIPLSDPSRPAQVRVWIMNGGITVRGTQGKEIIVDPDGRSGDRPRRDPVPPKAQGLRRVDINSSIDIDVEEKDNSVNIVPKHAWRGQELVISVPVNTSLDLKTKNNGEILVEGVNGEVAANNMNGNVVLKNVSGSVLANSMNGDVTVIISRFDPSKPSSFSTMNGDIDVTLPADVKARVKLKANNGEVFSDFDIKTEGSQNKPATVGTPGRYKVRFDQATFGTINGGGPEIQFSNFNGQIMIRKK